MEVFGWLSSSTSNKAEWTQHIVFLVSQPCVWKVGIISMTNAIVTFLNQGRGSALTTTARDSLEQSLLQLTAARKMSKNTLTFTLMNKGLVKHQFKL